MATDFDALARESGASGFDDYDTLASSFGGSSKEEEKKVKKPKDPKPAGPVIPSAQEILAKQGLSVAPAGQKPTIQPLRSDVRDSFLTNVKQRTAEKIREAAPVAMYGDPMASVPAYTSPTERQGYLRGAETQASRIQPTKEEVEAANRSILDKAVGALGSFAPDAPEYLGAGGLSRAALGGSAKLAARPLLTAALAQQTADTVMDLKGADPTALTPKEDITLSDVVTGEDKKKAERNAARDTLRERMLANTVTNVATAPFAAFGPLIRGAVGTGTGYGVGKALGQSDEDALAQGITQGVMSGALGAEGERVKVRDLPGKLSPLSGDFAPDTFAGVSTEMTTVRPEINAPLSGAERAAATSADDPALDAGPYAPEPASKPTARDVLLSAKERRKQGLPRVKNEPLPVDPADARAFDPEVPVQKQPTDPDTLFENDIPTFSPEDAATGTIEPRPTQAEPDVRTGPESSSPLEPVRTPEERARLEAELEELSALPDKYSDVLDDDGNAFSPVDRIAELTQRLATDEGLPGQKGGDPAQPKIEAGEPKVADMKAAKTPEALPEVEAPQPIPEPTVKPEIEPVKAEESTPLAETPKKSEDVTLAAGPGPYLWEKTAKLRNSIAPWWERTRDQRARGRELIEDDAIQTDYRYVDPVEKVLGRKLSIEENPYKMQRAGANIPDRVNLWMFGKRSDVTRAKEAEIMAKGDDYDRGFLPDKTLEEIYEAPAKLGVADQAEELAQLNRMEEGYQNHERRRAAVKAELAALESKSPLARSKTHSEDVSELRSTLKKYPDYKMTDGMSIEELRAKRDALRSSLSPEQLQAAEQFHKDYSENISHKLLGEMRRAGIVGDEEYQRLLSAGQQHIPLYNVAQFVEEAAEGRLQAGTGFDSTRQSVLSKLKGSEEDLVDFPQAAATQIARSLAIIHGQRVRQALVKYAGKEGVPVRAIRQASDAFADEAAFPVFENGKVKYYAAPKEVVSSINRLNRAQIDKISQWAGQFTGLLRQGAVGINAAFIPANVVRDVGQANVLAPYKGGIDNKTPVNTKAWVKAFANTMGQWSDPYYRAWVASGGSMSSYSSLLRDPKQMRKVSDQLRLPGESKARSTINSVEDLQNLLKTLRDSEEGSQKPGAGVVEEIRSMSEAAENATRLAVFKAGIEAGDSPMQSAFESRNASGDFNRAGVLGRLLGYWVPFLTPRKEGFVNMLRVAKERPKEFAWRVGRHAVMPAMLAAAWNDAFFPEVYNAIDQQDRDNYFHLIYGSGTNEYGEFNQVFRIPKPEIVQGFANGVEFMIDAALANNDRNARQMLTQVASDLFVIPFAREGEVNAQPAVSMFTPSLFRPALEASTNTRVFTGQPIETQADRERSPHLRYDDRTSEAAKILGALPKKLGMKEGVSPKQIDNAIYSLFAGVGQQVTNPQQLPRLLTKRFVTARPKSATAKDEALLEENTRAISDEEFLRVEKAKSLLEEARALPVEKRAEWLQDKIAKKEIDDPMVDAITKVTEKESDQKVEKAIRAVQKLMPNERMTPDERKQAVAERKAALKARVDAGDLTEEEAGRAFLGMSSWFHEGRAAHAKIPARAGFVLDKMNAAKTPEEKEITLQMLIQSKILTDKVVDAILELEEEKKRKAKERPRDATRPQA